MNIELKEIDKDTLKVGDWVGVAREVSYGWGLSFRHKLIFRHKLQESLQSEPNSLRISLENMTKEVFYECDSEAARENFLAKTFRDIQDGIFELTESKRKDRIRKISDEDLPEVARHMKAITEILKKYKE